MLRGFGFSAIVYGVGQLLTIIFLQQVPANLSADELALINDQRRWQAILGGGAIVAGIVMVNWKPRNTVVPAVTADRWLSIHISDEAAAFAKRIIAERKYVRGTGLRIESSGNLGRFEIKYDIVSDYGQDFLGEDKGISVFANETLARTVDGQHIELCDGRLILSPNRL